MTNNKNYFEIPLYLKKIITNYPKLKSGRRNYRKHEKRILDTIELIKKFKKNNFLR